jgi:uncharacterized protein
MNTTGLKVVIDTNIVIAMIGKKSPFRWIFDKIISGEFIMCISNEILFEYHEIMTRKNGPIVSENFSNFLITHPYVEKYAPTWRFRLLSHDEDDNKFVDCAIVSNAFCLVSNDSDLKILDKIEFPKVTLLNLSEFEKRFKDN